MRFRRLVEEKEEFTSEEVEQFADKLMNTMLNYDYNKLAGLLFRVLEVSRVYYASGMLDKIDKDKVKEDIQTLTKLADFLDEIK